jgi:hypothetical protein
MNEMNPNRSKPTTARDRIVALRDFEKLATLKDASPGDIEEGTLTLRSQQNPLTAAGLTAPITSSRAKPLIPETAPDRHHIQDWFNTGAACHQGVVSLDGARCVGLLSASSLSWRCCSSH